MFNCLFIYLFCFLQTFQLTDELQTFSAEVRDASVDSLEKSLTCYHVVSVVVEGILALCKEVSVLFLSAADVYAQSLTRFGKNEGTTLFPALCAACSIFL